MYSDLHNSTEFSKKLFLFTLCVLDTSGTPTKTVWSCYEFITYIVIRIFFFFYFHSDIGICLKDPVSVVLLFPAYVQQKEQKWISVWVWLCATCFHPIEMVWMAVMWNFVHSSNTHRNTILLHEYCFAFLHGIIIISTSVLNAALHGPSRCWRLCPSLWSRCLMFLKKYNTL